MSYAAMGPVGLDYLPCRYGTSKLLFRGPRRSLGDPFVAFIGGTETYGKFTPTPFPELVEEQVELTAVNFGYPNAGVDVFAYDPFVSEAASKAEVTVIQILGAQNMTNRFYSVHPRRNDRFVAASMLLKTIYRDVDFSEFHFNRHMLGRLLFLSPERFETVRAELQQAWVARMRMLLKQIQGKTVLLWAADHAPFPGEMPMLDGLGSDPLFVTREMIHEIKQEATEYAEVILGVEEIEAGRDMLVYNEMEEPAASEMFGAVAHGRIAAEVGAKLRLLL